MNPLLAILKAILRIAQKGDLQPVLYRKQKINGQVVYRQDETVSEELSEIAALCKLARSSYFGRQNNQNLEEEDKE